MRQPTAKIVATRHFPEAVEARLASEFDAVLNPDDTALSADHIVERCAGADGLLVSAGAPIDGALINRLPQSVRIIATFSVGYEHIDVATAAARGIAVTNTPGVLTEATADIALLLLLGAARRAFEGERMIRTNQWHGWTPTQLMGMELGGRRLGIFGMGRIGHAVARRARAFGMEIHYHNRSQLLAEAEIGATYHETPEALLAVSDVLSLHCPATPQTIKFLNAERLALLPDGAIVVNTARGAVVDDAALIAALKSGKLAAAGLDVFDGEPNIHPGYRDCVNTFLLPHMGSATVDTRNAMGFTALDNLAAFFAGQTPPNLVRL